MTELFIILVVERDKLEIAEEETLLVVVIVSDGVENEDAKVESSIDLLMFRALGNRIFVVLSG